MLLNPFELAAEGRCVVCGGFDTFPTDAEHKEKIYIEEARCNDCGAKWCRVFELKYVGKIAETEDEDDGLLSDDD